MDHSECGLVPTSGAMTKIRRPPNAYIIFAREWRQKLAAKYPEEECIEISVR
jgi:hypothetical protein